MKHITHLIFVPLIFYMLTNFDRFGSFSFYDTDYPLAKILLIIFAFVAMTGYGIWVVMDIIETFKNYLNRTSETKSISYSMQVQLEKLYEKFRFSKFKKMRYVYLFVFLWNLATALIVSFVFEGDGVFFVTLFFAAGVLFAIYYLLPLLATLSILSFKFLFYTLVGDPMKGVDLFKKEFSIIKMVFSNR